MNLEKMKSRRGVGHIGRVFQYGTALTPNGAQLGSHVEAQEKNIKKLNKDPVMHKAAKKAAHRSDAKFHKDY